VNHDNEQLIRQLRDELGSLEVPPAPVIAVTQRGNAIRARRRALAAGFAGVVAVALLAARFIGAAGPGPGTVTLNQPNPRAPGGVFASGTANGKPWRLAVRNIAADPGTRFCLPAVMFNGRDGDVLYKTAPGVPSFGNPAFFSHIPGFPGVGAVFTQVSRDVTRLVTTFPGGRRLAASPVWVSACGHRFHLAGFAFPMREAGATTLAAYTTADVAESLDVNFRQAAMRVPEGIWVDWDMSWADLSASKAATRIGTGTVAGQSWHITTALGLFGQCYTGTLQGDGGHGRSHECMPVAAPPATITLNLVPVPGRSSEFVGYAGVVNPRTKELVVSFTDAPDLTVTPVNVAGRVYVAFVVPPGCQVTRLRLAGPDGHVFATVTAPPPGQGAVVAWPPRGAGKASQRVIYSTPVQVTP
jgi:hypothetical protein